MIKFVGLEDICLSPFEIGPLFGDIRSFLRGVLKLEFWILMNCWSYTYFLGSIFGARQFGGWVSYFHSFLVLYEPPG